MQIGAAHPRREDLDEDLFRPGLGTRDVDDIDFAATFEADGPHRSGEAQRPISRFAPSPELRTPPTPVRNLLVR